MQLTIILSSCSCTGEETPGKQSLPWHFIIGPFLNSYQLLAQTSQNYVWLINSGRTNNQNSIKLSSSIWVCYKMLSCTKMEGFSLNRSYPEVGARGNWTWDRWRVGAPLWNRPHGLGVHPCELGWERPTWSWHTQAHLPRWAQVWKLWT